MIDSTVLTRFNSLQKYWFSVGVCDALCGLRHIFRCITKTNGSQTHLKRCGAISFKKNRPSIINKPLASLAVWKIQTGKLSRWDGESIVVHSIAFGYIRRHTHTHGRRMRCAHGENFINIRAWKCRESVTFVVQLLCEMQVLFCCAETNSLS